MTWGLVGGICFCWRHFPLRNWLFDAMGQNTGGESPRGTNIRWKKREKVTVGPVPLLMPFCYYWADTAAFCHLVRFAPLL